MDNTSKPIRLGIIGAGHIGGRHANHAARLPNAAVTAVADLHLEKSVALAQSLGATPFNDPDSLLQSDVDAVIVSVPTFAHRSVVERALAAGKHVLSEKPLALTISDCDTLIAAADDTGRHLMVGHVIRFFPAYAHAKRMIDRGTIGSPAAVRTRRATRYPTTPWFADPTQSGGILGDLLIHDFDFLLWCFGPVIRVHARTLTDQKLAHLDYALVTLRHANGVIAHLEGVWGEPGGTHTTFEIAGDGGMLVHDSQREQSIRTAIRSEGGAEKIASQAPLTPNDDPYYRQLAAFVSGIQNNTPPAVSARDARAALIVALAAQESARSGRAITIEEGTHA